MRIFLDGRAPYGGIGRHVRWLRRNLSRHFGPELVVYRGRERSEPAPGRSPARAAAGALKRIAVDQWVVPRLVGRSGADLFHSPNYLVPRGLRVPAVVHCYDLTLVDHFETKKRGAMKFYERRSAIGALERARFILTLSETVRRQIIERFGVAPERILAIPPALARLPVTPDEGRLPAVSRGPFFLHVGTLEPRKNLARLLDAHEKIWRQARVPLLLAGGYGWRQRVIVERARHSAGAVHWLGRVSDEVLGALYQRATAVVQPSLAEGFDLPVLEAMAIGAPLVVSELAVHREVAGDLALYAPALDSGELAGRMEEILGWAEERRSGHARHARARAKTFGSRATVERYLDVYRRVLDA